MKIITAISLNRLTVTTLALTLALIIGLLLFMLSACSKNNGLKELTCVVSTTEQGECQSIPTLYKGALNLRPNGTFELAGNYTSCYQSSNVRILGQYQHSITASQIVEIELSAEKINQDDSKKIEFPRTIGLINLDLTTQQGNFIDIWSNIRTKGLVKQQTIAKKLECKSA